MTATTITALTHTAIVIALLVIFALTGDHEVLTAALGYAGAASVGAAAVKASS